MRGQVLVDLDPSSVRNVEVDESPQSGGDACHVRGTDTTFVIDLVMREVAVLASDRLVRLTAVR
jgi:hypothetical protein